MTRSSGWPDPQYSSRNPYYYGSPIPLTELSSAELRVELAHEEATKAKSWRGSYLRRDRIKAITRELIDRGSF